MELVVGATGSLGGKIVRELVRRGGPVRALARHADRAASLETAGAEVLLGNLKDPATLLPACRGVDVVVSTASASNRSDDTPENVDLRGNRLLIDAAREAGVRRFVFISTLGATDDSPVAVFRAKAGTEAHLRASGMEHVILQPAAFMDVWFGMLIEGPVLSGQPVTLVGESTHRHAFIAEEDVAQFAAAAARGPRNESMTVPLGGPEAVTWLQVVEAYEEAIGRAIPVRSVPPGAPIPGAPELVWGIAAAFETYESIIPMQDTCALFGVSLTSVREFARKSPIAEGAAGG